MRLLSFPIWDEKGKNMKRIISLALAVLITAFVAIPVFASDSPGKPPVYTAEVSSSDNSLGTVVKTINSDGTITITASPISNEFTKWVITGEYELISGSLTDKTIVIRLKSDVTAVAYFNGKAVDGSPTTGASAVSALMLLSLFSAGVALYSCKRLCR